MEFSLFGQRFTKFSGITQLMHDLNEGIRSGDDVIMLGGGNPAQIPEMLARFNSEAQQLLSSGDLVAAMSNYDGPQGKNSFTTALATLLNKTYGWELTDKNIALTNGSQNAFFYLFNLFAGDFAGNKKKKVLFPLAPEYIGYTDTALSDDFFETVKPKIELLDDGLFKYHVDFDNLHITDDIGLICVSRPTNPTGNVLTDEEMQRLDTLARQHNIPLLIDNAYGTPFPNIIFEPVEPIYNDNTILCMSLSKLGLPGTRCGIVIGNEEVISAISNLSGIINLAPGSLGPMLAQNLVESGDIISLSEDVIKPYYYAKAQQAVTWLQDSITDERFRIHKPEGAIFLWLWFKDLPISSQELYERLKTRGVLIVSGHHFFPGLDEEWRHTDECIRMNYSQPDDAVQRGIKIIAEEVQKAYAEMVVISTATA
ncbi:MAG: valine--pyruvate transaminase [Moritella sp.]|uniref:valine--pyruvate transaminase n=1 Tax=Moritella sp. TaxID=78556 RepID=UPI000C10AFF2|nr:valine--pyruvate transaminase [Moritella sp.]MBL1416645.1 valine--pyruvate transaminase [Moritella sp.]NQZ94567.1 valine--pyruvate transaminase [Moritella sp.]PHR86671.1 MAG: valine--pyruvate transaminase [Moritella sp.]